MSLYGRREVSLWLFFKRSLFSSRYRDLASTTQPLRYCEAGLIMNTTSRVPSAGSRCSRLCIRSASRGGPWGRWSPACRATQSTCEGPPRPREPCMPQSDSHIHGGCLSYKKKHNNPLIVAFMWPIFCIYFITFLWLPSISLPFLNLPNFINICNSQSWKWY